MHVSHFLCKPEGGAVSKYMLVVSKTFEQCNFKSAFRPHYSHSPTTVTCDPLPFFLPFTIYHLLFTEFIPIHYLLFTSFHPLPVIRHSFSNSEPRTFFYFRELTTVNWQLISIYNFLFTIYCSLIFLPFTVYYLLLLLPRSRLLNIELYFTFV